MCARWQQAFRCWDDDQVAALHRKPVVTQVGQQLLDRATDPQMQASGGAVDVVTELAATADQRGAAAAHRFAQPTVAGLAVVGCRACGVSHIDAEEIEAA